MQQQYGNEEEKSAILLQPSHPRGGGFSLAPWEKERYIAGRSFRISQSNCDSNRQVQFVAAWSVAHGL